jgi:agmatine/peptidylarginine deiminase
MSGNSTVAIAVTKQFASAGVVIASFIFGMLWASRTPDGPRGEAIRKAAGIASLSDPESTTPALVRKSSRFGVGEAAPEDFYPAAEFREQAGILLGCYDQLNTDPELYLNIARAVNGRLPLFGLVHNEEQALRGVEYMRENGVADGTMYFVPFPADSIWIRDYAPFMVRRKDNSITMIDAKYMPRNPSDIREKDEEMAAGLADILGLPLRSIPLLLEGGNLLSNGDGSILTTARILHANQGFDFSLKQVTDLMSDFIGMRRWSYVPQLEGEPTGHIDMFATILAKNIVVVGEIPEQHDPINFAILNRAANHFSAITTSLGPMKVERIPIPPNWGRNWRSYTNLILANGILLMPSFSDAPPEVEDLVESTFRRLLPAWEIKRIPCDALVKEGGQLHCLSYGLPKYVALDGLYERAFPKLPKNLSSAVFSAQARNPQAATSELIPNITLQPALGDAPRQP